jgi:hypothetical protein
MHLVTKLVRICATGFYPNERTGFLRIHGNYEPADLLHDDASKQLIR